MKFGPRSKAVAIAIAAGLALPVVTAIPAQAADKPVGALKCLQLREIHTVSRSSGTVTHQIYGAMQFGSMWETTNSAQLGWSAGVTNWNHHHWLYNTMKGGKVFGTSAVQSASSQCE